MPSPRKVRTGRAVRIVRGVRTVRGAGCPQAAIVALTRAYQAAIRAAYEQAIGKVSDAQESVAGLIAEATRKIRASAAEKLREIPGFRADALVGPEAVAEFRSQNAQLVKALAGKVTREFEQIVSGQAGGTRPIAEQLTERFGVSMRKAEFWAEDQALKFHADVTQTQHERLGITEYFWRTSLDGTVREEHAALEGTRQKYSDPPVVSKDGRTANPGKDYRCRCHADPILPEDFPEESPAPVAAAPKRRAPKPPPKPTALPDGIRARIDAAKAKVERELAQDLRRFERMADRSKAAEYVASATARAAKKQKNLADFAKAKAKGPVGSFATAGRLSEGVLTEGEIGAVQSFTGSMFTSIREAGQKLASGEKLGGLRRSGAWARLLERAIGAGVEFRGTLYRGIVLPEADAAKLLAQSEWSWAGKATSTSVDRSIAAGFAETGGSSGNVAVVLEISNGRGLALGGDLGIGKEREVIQSGRARFRVLSHSREGHRITVKLEQIE